MKTQSEILKMVEDLDRLSDSLNEVIDYCNQNDIYCFAQVGVSLRYHNLYTGAEIIELLNDQPSLRSTIINQLGATFGLDNFNDLWFQLLEQGTMNYRLSITELSTELTRLVINEIIGSLRIKL